MSPDEYNEVHKMKRRTSLSRNIRCVCGSVHVIKNGHRDGKQRLQCLDCNRYFYLLMNIPNMYEQNNLERQEMLVLKTNKEKIAEAM